MPMVGWLYAVISVAGTLDDDVWTRAAAGRFRMLLARIETSVEPGRADGDVLGFREAGTVDGQTAPAGYHVWVAPHWYVWREDGTETSPRRAWGSEQTVGPPDTKAPGDQQSAWASRTQDDADEWLLVEFAEPITPSVLQVFETYHPGALRRVRVAGIDGVLRTAWSGTDPIPPSRPMGIAHLPIESDRPLVRVVLDIASSAVDGWNEIDAVGLIDAHGKTHWPVAAMASSEFADAEDVRYSLPPSLIDPEASGTQPGSDAPPSSSNPALAAERAARRVALDATIERLQAELKVLQEALQKAEAERQALEDDSPPPAPTTKETFDG